MICYRCGRVGHIAAKCQTGRGPVTGRIPTGKPQGAVTTDMEIDWIYPLFVGKGYIYGQKKKKIAVTILRDTGASQSILLKEKLPRGKNVIVKGIGGKRTEVSLYKVEHESKWKTVPIIVGVIDSLPMKGIIF